ncbi:MAG: hypothetical protein R3224_00770 [Balneolaceae bacterium]|nr:hypothetical protein [Balneolaceae bacterium]
MEEVLMSGNSTFRLEVPHKLIEIGEKGKKPLIVYLHGFNQNIEMFRKLTDEFRRLEAYHLFIQGPYPLYDRSREKSVDEWGRAWYLYDGSQDRFVRSLETTSEFIQEVIQSIRPHIRASRLCLFGYSMGGYQAGYFALSRPQLVNELVVVGGRIKTEVFEEKQPGCAHLNVLALHGTEDESVLAGPQRKSVRQLEGWGADVTFKTVEKGHALSSVYNIETIEWLITLGYRKA